MVERSRKQYDDPIEEFNGSGLFNGWRREVMKPRYQHWDGSYTIHSFIPPLSHPLGFSLFSPFSLPPPLSLFSSSCASLSLLSPSSQYLFSLSSHSNFALFPPIPTPTSLLIFPSSSFTLLFFSSSLPFSYSPSSLPLLFYPCPCPRHSPYSLILLSSSTSDLPLLTIFSSSFSPFFLSLSPSFLL